LTIYYKSIGTPAAVIADLDKVNVEHPLYVGAIDLAKTAIALPSDSPQYNNGVDVEIKGYSGGNIKVIVSRVHLALDAPKATEDVS